jgi:hypothetical protein
MFPMNADYDQHRAPPPPSGCLLFAWRVTEILLTGVSIGAGCIVIYTGITIMSEPRFLGIPLAWWSGGITLALGVWGGWQFWQLEHKRGRKK